MLREGKLRPLGKDLHGGMHLRGAVSAGQEKFGIAQRMMGHTV